MKKYLSVLLSAALICVLLAGCATSGAVESTGLLTQPSETDPAQTGEICITLEGNAFSVQGDDNGTAVYPSWDILYYEDREFYDSGNLYGSGDASDRHDAAEAAAHLVVNITAPGTYRLSGALTLGQIRVDLGSSAAEDPDALVTLILDGADITCTVGPCILFRNVWGGEGGARLVLADGSENSVSGVSIPEIYADTPDRTTWWQSEGAVFSCTSLEVSGSGSLEVSSDSEAFAAGGTLTVTAENIQTQSPGITVTPPEDMPEKSDADYTLPPGEDLPGNVTSSRT